MFLFNSLFDLAMVTIIISRKGLRKNKELKLINSILFSRPKTSMSVCTVTF